MLAPSPFAHHSRLWKPLPEKRQAKRTGGSDEAFFGFSSPQTESDSSQGRAIETPRPRRKVRRERSDLGAVMVISVRHRQFTPEQSSLPPIYSPTRCFTVLSSR